MKKFFWVMCLSVIWTADAFSQIGWWTSSDTLNVFNKNKGAVLIGSYQPLGKLTVGPDDKFYNLALVGDYNNLAKNYLQIGVTSRGFENLQGQTVFDLYHSNSQLRNAGYNFRINGQSQFFINGEGNIGIGTEKPEAKLDLTGGPNWGGFTKVMRLPGEHAIKFESGGNEYGMVATGGMINFVVSNQNQSTNPFGVPFSRIMSLQRNKVIIEGDIEIKGKIYSQGQVSGGGDVIPIETGGGTGGGVVDNWDGGSKGDGGILPTIAPQGSGAQDWVISSSNANDIYYTYGSGEVGIGTNNPTYKLDVNGTTRISSTLTVNDATSVLNHTIFAGDGGTINLGRNSSEYISYHGDTGAQYLDFGPSNLAKPSYIRSLVTGQPFYIVGSGSALNIGNATSNDINFFTNNTTRVTINTAGTVGIGTTTPAGMLDVSGVTGNIFVRSSTGTNFTYQDFINTGGVFRLGREKSVGGGLLAGTSAYDGVLTVQSAHNLHLGTNSLIRMSILSTGSVGIGTTNPGTDKLAVNGTIRAKELYLTTAGWSDFVFEQGYNLRTLKQVENYIKKNGRLPDIPSQKEVEEKGVGVIDMQAKLLQKIEELTLYVIEQNKKNEEQNKRIQELEEKLTSKKH